MSKWTKEYKKEYLRKWNKENMTTEQRRDKKYKERYGISLTDYNQMLTLQNGKCKICNKAHKSGRSLHVDHCHTTGKVRGLLCYRCNSDLAFVETYKKEIEEYLK